MDFLSVIRDNILPIFATVISFVSLIVVIWNNRKKTKSDQFRIALDMNYRIEDIDNKLGQVNEKFNSSSKTESDRKSYLISKEDLTQENMNTLEFFALLINNDEITIESIIKHFKPTFIEVTGSIFREFPELKNDEKKYEEVKKLLKRFENGEFKD